MSVCQYVSMSICQYVRMQLFSLGIKMKVVHNVIRMSDSQKILVRKSLRTAKEPALVSNHMPDIQLSLHFNFHAQSVQYPHELPDCTV